VVNVRWFISGHKRNRKKEKRKDRRRAAEVRGACFVGSRPKMEVGARKGQGEMGEKK